MRIAKSVLATVIARFYAFNEAGVEVEQVIKLKGKTLTQPEWESVISKHHRAAENLSESERRAANAVYFAELFSEWDVQDPEGQPMVCDAAGFAALLESPAGMQALAGIGRAVNQLRFGTPVKN